MHTRLPATNTQRCPALAGKIVGVSALILPLILVGCSDSSNPSSAGPESTAASTQAGVPAANPGSEIDEPVVDNTQTTPSTVLETQARYRVTFAASWSPDTHPLGFPGNPHFSPMTGATHNAQVIFWQPGQMASSGIEQMAESGSTSQFREEIDFSINSGYAQNLINVGSVPISPGTTSGEFDISLDFPMITLTSMLAPSPDWFVGVHGLMLHDGQQFLPQVSVELDLYDSGTDSGLNYTSANADTQPPAPISLLSSDNADSPFVDGKPIVGTITLEKL